MKPAYLIQMIVVGLGLVAAEVTAAEEPVTPTSEPHAEAEPEHEAHGKDEHENHFFAGAKGAYLYAMQKDGNHHHAGAGIFFELSLLPHMLELEISVKAMSAHEGVVMPIDILLKVPFHPLPKVNPFIGLGPAMALVIDDGVEAHFGGAVAAGSYFWVHPHVALSAELNFNLLYAHGPAYEYGGAVGVLAGW